MKKTRYPWELGTKLATEIQAKGLKSARESILALVSIIWQESGQRSFDEVKLRVLQVLTIANRAAYYAGANPERLCNTNINLVKRMITVRTKRQLLALIKHVVTEFIALVPDRDFLSSTRLDKAISYIREHCTEGISRDNVAQVVGCSSSYLSTLFTRIVGHTFKDVVLKYRMEKAKEFLRQGNKTITEVAFKVGYNEPNYFSTAFKKITGVTPRQYRKQML